MSKPGTVTLVGAGPGDPALLTLAGKQALERAQVVLYDHLANPALLSFAPPAALLLDVGKQGSRHPVPQEEINALLLEHAADGKRVVRLKGGDPYLFGRGGEELLYLREHGIPFTTIPGVSSAISAPAAAGIPVTHRGLSSSLHIFTGHGKGDSPPPIDYGTAAKLGGTLVFLMGVAALDDICSGLLAAGMPSDTPAALVENATLPGQRQVAGTVASIAGLSRQSGIRPPAILVVGQVCTLSRLLSPSLPLSGVTVAVAVTGRPPTTLGKLLREWGACVHEIPVTHRKPLPLPENLEALLEQHRWLAFTSTYGVEAFFDGLLSQNLDARSLAKNKVSAVGEKTAAALAVRGIRADLIPESWNGESLGQALSEAVQPGESILLIRAEAPAPGLSRQLDAVGIPFGDISVYCTLPAEGQRLPLPKDIDCIAFMSASAVNCLAGGDAIYTGVPAVCIGEATAAAACERGYGTITAKSASQEALACCILENWGGKTHGSDS